MLKNHLKIAWRNLQRNKGFSFLNIAGLALGITCSLVIALYILHEQSFDKYHEQGDRVYRVLHAVRTSAETEMSTPPDPQAYSVWGNAPVGRALKETFPEIQEVTQFTSPRRILLQYGEKRFLEDNIVMADSAFFDVFSWNVLAGNPHHALQQPNGIVLTQSTARRYFGDADPIDNVVEIPDEAYFNPGGGRFTVLAVVEDVPANSHFTFDGLIAMPYMQTAAPDIFNDWGYVDFYTYFLTAPHTDIATVKTKIPDFLSRHGHDPKTAAYSIDFEALTDAYLHSVASHQPGITGNPKNLQVFAYIALFILVIAAVNFMNLSTARAVERAKEIGVKKTVGALPRNLMAQFLLEALLVTYLSLFAALFLSFILTPLISQLTGKALTISQVINWRFFPLILGGTTLLGILAGSYPAWVLTRFKAVQVLKGPVNGAQQGVTLRKALVVFQFSLSFALIFGTIVLFSQLHHLRSQDLGFEQQQTLVIDYGNDFRVNQQLEAVKDVFAKIPGVTQVSASRAVPGDPFPDAYTTIVDASGEMKGYNIPLYEIDQDFITSYGIELVAGRAFSRDFPADTAQSLIVNEAAAKQYGYMEPEHILGKRFDQWGRQGTVVGVVKNFHYQSLHQGIRPMVIRYADPFSFSKLSLRLNAADLEATVNRIAATWKEQVPHRPLRFTFLDESFNKQYQADLRFGQLFSLFSIIAIGIACLGLLGLSAYMTAQRVKEIGIRKVLGASALGIVQLLSKDFVKLVLLALVIASPVAWWAMNQWLQDFAYRIDIQWWMFGLAGLAAVVIALLTISFQAVKAAVANPVDSLKDE